MRRYSCPNCGNEVHFQNTQCINCSALLGYVPGLDRMLSADAATSAFGADGEARAACANREAISCNWLVIPGKNTHGVAGRLCTSCSRTTIIPDLSAPGNIERWARLESAKRLLFYSIEKFHLPLESAGPDGDTTLRFNLKGDKPALDGTIKRVLTGHENGLITINIAEADDDVREKNRTAMGEPYRTLIGHFRHEVGHFYWDCLIRDGGRNSDFTACFGDASVDYAAALSNHYQNGPPADWRNHHVSAYASAHPWEDFAETWAHYIHMIDALETAFAYNVTPQPIRAGGTAGTAVTEAASLPETPYKLSDWPTLVEAWIPLTVAMNAMSQSIGNHDFYPFVLTEAILHKLGFIHDLIQTADSITMEKSIR
ncbi:MAG: putative zinc-binding metallopeptidase [Rhizobiales bacterium]|nr:putative zinc-binding metallopeptidase [Hyphomicrobiales bacterium]